VLLLPKPVLFRARHVLEAACTSWGHERLLLEELDVDSFPGFENAAVTVAALPRHHPWVSPLGDQVAVVKLAMVAQPDRILEVGSFQGHTALLLAMNLPQAELTTIDVLEDHGEAYFGGPFADRIERHIGSIETLPEERSFDFIFVDNGHGEAEVRRDTRSSVSRLAPGGIIVWHDYCDTYWTSKLNRVPEVLTEYAKELPIRSLGGTNLAVYRAPG